MYLKDSIRTEGPDTWYHAHSKLHYQNIKILIPF